jgi:hypothetical protein
VAETNKENKQLTDLISQLETNGYVPQANTGLEGSVNEATPSQNGDNVTTPTDPNTNLVSPVNTVSGEGTQNQPANQPAQ